MRLKAYSVTECHENQGFICWAENPKEAKKLGIGSDETYGADYIDLRCRRAPEADEMYYGKAICDWYTEEGQRIYWKLGWWLEDGRQCQGCYDCWEYDKVPESRLNDDGLCSVCAKEQPKEEG